MVYIAVSVFKRYIALVHSYAGFYAVNNVFCFFFFSFYFNYSYVLLLHLNGFVHSNVFSCVRMDFSASRIRYNTKALFKEGDATTFNSFLTNNVQNGLTASYSFSTIKWMIDIRP